MVNRRKAVAAVEPFHIGEGLTVRALILTMLAPDGSIVKLAQSYSRSKTDKMPGRSLVEYGSAS